MRLPLALLLEDRRRSWLETFAGEGRTLELIVPGRDELGDFDPQCLGQALDAFVAWRASAVDGGSTARLAGVVEGRAVPPGMDRAGGLTPGQRARRRPTPDDPSRSPCPS